MFQNKGLLLIHYYFFLGAPGYFVWMFEVWLDDLFKDTCATWFKFLRLVQQCSSLNISAKVIKDRLVQLSHTSCASYRLIQNENLAVSDFDLQSDFWCVSINRSDMTHIIWDMMLKHECRVHACSHNTCFRICRS